MEHTYRGITGHTPQTDLPAHKITRAFEQAKQNKRGLLIPYFMCGYPTEEQSIKIILAAAEGGADIIELGMPFSDPLADGATIQHAGHIALEHGMSIKRCMHIAHQISAQSPVPLILMGYYNPILSYGLEDFCIDAKASGVSGLIVPDLPPEEAEPLEIAAHKQGLTVIFLIPPTTPDDRIHNIVKRTINAPGGFIYCVSLSGVTGSRAELPTHLQTFITRIRKHTAGTNIPLVVGFGLSKPEHIATVTSHAEGAVVGSALVNLINQQEEQHQVEAVRQYIQSLSPTPASGRKSTQV